MCRLLLLPRRELLARDGANIASVLGLLGAHSQATKQRIEEYLAKVVAGVQRVDSKSIGPKETLEFGQQMAGSSHPRRFLAANMSDDPESLKKAASRQLNLFGKSLS